LLFKAFYYFKDIDGDGINELIRCSSGNYCGKKNNIGYFLVNTDEKTNALLFCTNKNNNISCSFSNNGDGLFKNNYDSDIIKCTDSICQNTNRYFNICKNNTISAYQYCEDNDYLSFQSNTKYYPLENVNALSTFPNIKYGNDSILLKFEEFSITQFLTNLTGNN